MSKDSYDGPELQNDLALASLRLVDALMTVLIANGDQHSKARNFLLHALEDYGRAINPRLGGSMSRLTNSSEDSYAKPLRTWTVSELFDEVQRLRAENAELTRTYVTLSVREYNQLLATLMEARGWFDGQRQSGRMWPSAPEGVLAAAQRLLAEKV